MNKLLIATTNPGKLAEIKKYLSTVPIQFMGLKDVHITDSVEETGKTFKENAILKAKYYFQKSGLPTIADDGGFEIDALGGEPGVRSHRWIDPTRESSDEELIAYTLEKMRGLPRAQRGAQLRLVLALVLPDGQLFTSESRVTGIVPVNPTGTYVKGFPFRSLLFLPAIQKYYNQDELTDEENAAYNHRKKALEKLIPIIKKYLV